MMSTHITVKSGLAYKREDKYRFLEKEHTVESVLSLPLSVFLCHSPIVCGGVINTGRECKALYSSLSVPQLALM